MERHFCASFAVKAVSFQKTRPVTLDDLREANSNGLDKKKERKEKEEEEGKKKIRNYLVRMDFIVIWPSIVSILWYAFPICRVNSQTAAQLDVITAISLLPFPAALSR